MIYSRKKYIYKMTDSLFEEIKTDELYHLYQTNSTKINKKLLQKFKEFPIITDFFKHYTNIDIKLLNENINIFFLQISSIADINGLNTFESSAEQYITDFSQLYIVLNAICKIKDSIEKIVSKINASLPMLYEKHCLDKDYQNKINEITRYMLNTNNKGNTSSISTFDNSENSFEFKAKSNKLLNIEKIELLKDLLGKENSNHTKMASLETPRFSNENNEFNSDSRLIKVNTNVSDFTFMDNNKIKKEEKLNGNQKENIENKDDNIISNDINDYITSVPKGSFLKKIKPLKRRSVYQSCKDLTSKSYRDTKEKNFQLHKDEKIPFHESSEKVMINEDSKMYADLLEIIYELYQNGKITYEQKVKLKKLIIKKCPKILSIYKNFQSDDNEKLAEQLKELV
jgi:hypothetical protein